MVRADWLKNYDVCWTDVVWRESSPRLPYQIPARKITHSAIHYQQSVDVAKDQGLFFYYDKILNRAIVQFKFQLEI